MGTILVIVVNLTGASGWSNGRSTLFLLTFQGLVWIAGDTCYLKSFRHAPELIFQDKC